MVLKTKMLHCLIAFYLNTKAESDIDVYKNLTLDQVKKFKTGIVYSKIREMCLNKTATCRTTVAGLGIPYMEFGVTSNRAVGTKVTIEQAKAREGIVDYPELYIRDIF